MQQQGLSVRYPSAALSVMGITEVLSKLPRILSIRRGLYAYFLKHPPDVFIGIDAPDFNLPLERKLKKQGIKTVHYVSPSIWAWREKRIQKVIHATDLVLTLFPFETDRYTQQGHHAVFVGHPLADHIPLNPDPLRYRKQLKIPRDVKVLALLPGSRKQELAQHLSCFIDTVQRCKTVMPALHIRLPLANDSLSSCVAPYQARMQQLGIICVAGQAEAVVGAADAVLLASGTATLEAMLLKKPMVVAYKMSAVTYWLAKNLVKIKDVSLPNILAGKRIVDEYIQEAMTPRQLSEALLPLLQGSAKTNALMEHYYRIHHQLRQRADENAAQAVERLLML